MELITGLKKAFQNKQYSSADQSAFLIYSLSGDGLLSLLSKLQNVVINRNHFNTV